jgi:dTDP-4-amino-4,6-dideoxygalactose transaminase
MSLHGISKDAWKRHSSNAPWYYEIIAPGFKYNMTDIAAALGIVQLQRASFMLDRRREIARAYIEAFKDCDALKLLKVHNFEDHAWHLFVVKLVDDKLKIDRNRFIEELGNRGIGASVHFIPLHMHPYYVQTMGYRPNDFPVAYSCYERSVSLPIYSKMTEHDTERVIVEVLDIIRKHRKKQ